MSERSAEESQARRNVLGWYTYDWANSAYITTAVGLLPLYFAGSIVGEDGAVLFGTRYRADTLWGVAVGLAGAVCFLLAPVLGAIADYSRARKRFLLFFAYMGALCCTLLYFTATGEVLRTLFFYVLTQIGFVTANVFYDSFLPHIAPEGKIDEVSARGFAVGYLGGGLQFALALALVSLHDKFGLTTEHAARIGVAMAGLWWAGFTFVAARMMAASGTSRPLPAPYDRGPQWWNFTRFGISRTLRTARQTAGYGNLLLFLLAFMFYNEGIQTVINMATIYGTRELKLPNSALMFTLLIIQFVAMFGSFLFGKIAGRIGTKRAIMITLGIWSGVVVYAYFIDTMTEFFILGMIVGLAMGGSQALSRSYYGSMIPKEASAEFFGFFTVFTKFSAIWGPWVFALITHLTSSARTAIVSLIGFFLVGLILLALVDEGKARQAREMEVPGS